MKNYRYEEERAIIKKTGIEFFLQKMPNKVGRVNPHTHSAIEILYIKKGSFRMFADDTVIEASEGCAVLFRSNTVHRIFPMDSGESFYYVLKVKPSLIMDFASDENRSSYLLSLALGKAGQKTLWSADETQKNGIARAIETMAHEEKCGEYGSDIAMKSCVAQVLLATLRDTRPDQSDAEASKIADNAIRCIYDTTVYINAHYAEELSAADCAARAFMSTGYFSRCFFSVTGKSFKDYLNTVRINRAERELFSTDRSVTEIAADCGFSNVSYFISVYKKQKGETPHKARRSL